MTEYSYNIQQPEPEQPFSMVEVLRTRLQHGLSDKLIQIMDQYNDKPLKIPQFAGQLTDTVLSIFENLEKDLQNIQDLTAQHNQVTENNG